MFELRPDIQFSGDVLINLVNRINIMYALVLTFVKLVSQ